MLPINSGLVIVNIMNFNLKKFYIVILLSVGTFIFLFNLGQRDLWDPDETRYAVVAREMRQTGNWILPHLNGRIYAEKPPLFFWLVNLFVLFSGEDSEFVNRLPSALAGLMIIIFTFLFGERLYDIRVGLFSGLVLSTCLLFPQISRWMMLDSLFTLLFILSLYYLYRGYNDDNKQKRFYCLSGLFIGLGIITKGPVIYLSIIILLFYSFIEKNMKKVWNRNLLLSFIISLVVTLIWLIPACCMGGELYMNEILFHQTVGRLAGKGIHFHLQPFYFYFLRFPLEFFPWVVFLPFSFLLGLKKGERYRQFLFLLVWFFCLFLFFTLSKGKKDNYLLPLYPAGALMVGFLWNLGVQSCRERRLFIILFLFLTLIHLLGIFIILSGRLSTHIPLFIEFQSLILTIFIYLSIGTLLSLLLWMKEKSLASFFSLVAVFSILHCHISYALPSRLNEKFSMKNFAEKILKRMESEDKLHTIFSQYPGLLYYTNKSYIREIETIDELIEVLHSPSRVFIVFQTKAFEEVRRKISIEMIPLEKTKVRHWDLILVSNH